MSGEDLQTGAWAGDQQEISATSLSGRGNDADAPDVVRFRRNVLGAIRRREHRTDAEFDHLAVFFLAPPTWFEGAPAEAVRNPLLNTGNFSLTGQIHCVNAIVAGRSIPFVGGPDDLLDALRALRADTLPTIVYVPKKGFSTLSWFPNGLAHDADEEVMDVADAEPTPESITAAIDSVHKGHLITPDQIIKDEQVWEDPSKGWAHARAEARVQNAVRLGLLGRFPPPYRIAAEQPGKDGRTDIEILEDARGASERTCHAVLELKVLRDKGSSGNSYNSTQIATHMNDGVEQAHVYGDGRNFRERMLCCFDMRATNAGGDVVLEPIKAKADTLGVHLRHWFLYRSSEHYRSCAVAEKLNAAKTRSSPR